MSRFSVYLGTTGIIHIRTGRFKKQQKRNKTNFTSCISKLKKSKQKQKGLFVLNFNIFLKIILIKLRLKRIKFWNDWEWKIISRNWVGTGYIAQW